MRKTLIALAVVALAIPYHAAAQSRFDDDSPIGSMIGAASSRPAPARAKAKAPAHKVAADGFYFERSSEIRKAVAISLVLYAGEAELGAARDRIDAEMKRPARPAGATTHAFAIMMGDRCEIHATDPAVLYQPEFLGHELLHCMLKEHFHPTQESGEER